MLKPFGVIERHPAGALVVAEGTMAPDMIITLSGATRIAIITSAGERQVGWMERGQFAGDISVLNGQRQLAHVTMGTDGDILRIDNAAFHRLIDGDATISDIFIRILSARRSFSQSRDATSVTVIGVAMDRQAYALRDLLAKHGIPHSWLDPQRDERAAAMLAERNRTGTALPVVLIGEGTILVQPTAAVLAAELGLDLLARWRDGRCHRGRCGTGGAGSHGLCGIRGAERAHA